MFVWKVRLTTHSQVLNHPFLYSSQLLLSSKSEQLHVMKMCIAHIMYISSCWGWQTFHMSPFGLEVGRSLSTHFWSCCIRSSLKFLKLNFYDSVCFTTNKPHTCGLPPWLVSSCNTFASLTFIGSLIVIFVFSFLKSPRSIAKLTWMKTRR